MTMPSIPAMLRFRPKNSLKRAQADDCVAGVMRAPRLLSAPPEGRIQDENELDIKQLLLVLKQCGETFKGHV
jgi:hypothetical protein